MEVAEHYTWKGAEYENKNVAINCIHRNPLNYAIWAPN
jgi:hypothetical protein